MSEKLMLPSVSGMLAGSLQSTHRNELAHIFEEETKGQDKTAENAIPLVKINHRLECFTIGGQSIGNELFGYPLHYFQQRTFWAAGYKEGQNSPPDCCSSDMVEPDSIIESPQSDSCLTCKWSKFGTARVGDGQACKTTTYFFLLNPEFVPVGCYCLLFPPSSIRSMLGTARSGGGFVGRAKQFRDPGGHAAEYYQIVWSRFFLSRASDNYCMLEAEPVSIAPSAEEVKAIASIRGSLMTAFKRILNSYEVAQETDES